MASERRLLAPAKLTLSLRVTGVREDGYHLLDAEMVSIDLADELTFRAGDGLEVVGEAGLPVASGEDNLVRRALAHVGRRAHVGLVKRIPAGAGLGGGSADAAAVLRWAGVGSGPGGPGPADLAMAARLGADVAFCLVGGRARVRGIGEVVERLPAEERALLLLLPPFGVSTPAVYRAWDDLGGPTAGGPNDLEPAALAVEPRLAAWRDALGEATGQAPVLAGSGSTWFVEGTPWSLGLDGRPELTDGGERGRLVAVRTLAP
ncbi:MAG: 4-(cytidine 5'-diphospho)-2-C-methyl-D-erythritol kinase [Acidimicrobiales bacterium]